MNDATLYNQVKGIIRSLELDQAQLAEKLGLNQANISKALNGGNEKTFRRIIELLESEYGVNSLNKHMESAVGNDLVEIKNELKEIKESIEALKEMIKNLEK